MSTQPSDSTDQTAKRIAELEAENAQLKARKQYGLVWDEEKTREQFEQDAENAFPVLKEVASKAIKQDAAQPTNILIEGDNYHALSVLNYTHGGKVEVIYIDPPYNTGAKDWKYNNNYVDKKDTYRHSKWLSMMQKRLRLAKGLLSDEGFICVTIDHNELFTLGSLMDEIFGEGNRLGVITVIIKEGGRNLSSFFGVSNEFYLVYAKDKNIAKFNSVAIDKKVRDTFNESDEKGRYKLREFIRDFDPDATRDLKPKFWYPIYVSDDLKTITLEKREGYIKVLPISTTNREMTWNTLPKTFWESVESGDAVVKKINERIEIFRKVREYQVFKTHWTGEKYDAIAGGTTILKKIIGRRKFDYPKSLYAVIDFLKITSKKDSVVCDFFAGSGTTAHAVLELNKQDGGNRQFILCTNNENQICKEVTYPRVSKVMRGYLNQKKAKVEGLGGNLRYFQTDFVKRAGGRDDVKIALTQKCTELLCLREGIFTEVKPHKKGKNPYYRIFAEGDRIMAVFHALGKHRLALLKTTLDKMKGEKVLYCFTLDPLGINDREFSDWQGVRLESIPQPILDIYEEIHEH